MIRKILLGLIVVACTCAGAAIAQQNGIKRTPLQKVEFPEGYVTVSGIAEVPPGGSAGLIPILASRPAICWKAKPI
jgi:hypothetical protein